MVVLLLLKWDTEMISADGLYCDYRQMIDDYTVSAAAGLAHAGGYQSLMLFFVGFVYPCLNIVWFASRDENSFLNYCHFIAVFPAFSHPSQ